MTKRSCAAGPSLRVKVDDSNRSERKSRPSCASFRASERNHRIRKESSKQACPESECLTADISRLSRHAQHCMALD